MKKIWLICFFLIIATTLFAYEVDKAEIQRNTKPIEFINYTGTHDEVDSAASIIGIGRALGSAVKTGKAGDPGKYYVIHAVDKSVKEGFDADILIIGPQAKVDHINNIRLIISGYLQAAYGYSASDAKTIAHFVTIYNAVYRKDMKTFKERYKPVVTNNLTADKAGLAVNYKEWPGKSQIIIPLSDPRFSGTISTVDTTTITDKKVVEKMQEKDDKDIPVRDDMIDLKEREKEEAEKRAKKAQKEAVLKEKEASKKQAAADKAKKEATEKEKLAKQKEKEAAEAKKKAEASKSEKDKKEAQKKQQEAEKAKKDATTKKDEAKKKEESASKAKEEVSKKKKDAEEEQKLADKKEKEAQDDRKNVAADTQKIIEEKANEKKAESDAAIASAIPGYGLKVVDKNKLLSELVLLDLKTAKELKTSAVDTIHGRCLFDANGKLMAIAGTTSGDGVITLVLFDPKTLEVVKQGDDNISADSILVKNENDYYAIVDQNGKYYVGRFDANLKLKAKSAIQVLSYTPITFTKDGIMVQTTNNSIRLLKATDLTDLMK